MMRRVLLRTAAAGIALCPVPVDAQVADTTRTDSTRMGPVLSVGSIHVSTTRTLTNVGGASAVVLQLDSLHLPAAPSLEETLRRVPMLHLRTNSRGESELVSRGSESRSVAVLQDGVPVTLGWDARADYSVLGGLAPQQLTFTRGLPSLLYGPNVLGGVVEMAITTDDPMVQRAAELAGGYDSDGGYRTAARLTVPMNAGSGRVVLRGGAAFRDSPGFALARGIDEPVPTSDDLRLNTDHRSTDVFGALRYWTSGGAWLSASATSTSGARGIAAELGEESPRLWRYPNTGRSIAVVAGGTGMQATPFGNGAFDVRLGLDAGRTEIVAYSDRTYSEQTEFENGDDRTLTLRSTATHTLGSRATLQTALTFADVRHDETLPDAKNRYRQRLMSLGAETTWRAADRLGPLMGVRITAGGAWDRAATLEAGDKPTVPDIDAWGARVGATALVGGTIQLHASASRRGRFPALRESFSGALNRFAPNPGLTPEYLTAVEAGATAIRGDAQLQLVAFHHRLDDAIVRITLPDRRYMRVNENELRTTGVEMLGSYRIGSVDVSGDVALQSAALITPTLRQGYMENQPEVFGSLRGRAPFVLGTDAALRAEYTGAQYCLAPGGENVRLRGGTRIGGDISKQWSVGRAESLLSRAEVRLSVDNATDVALHEQCGLPRPGRVARFQIRLF
jgi:iron complex outermembrane receptor protein